MTNALQDFRSLIQRLDPTKPIQRPEDHGWYVARPEGLAEKLARNIQIDHLASHLVVGAIGCGKSTELLAVGRLLNGVPGIFSRHVEISRLLDLQDADAATVLLAVMDELVTHLENRHPDEHVITKLREDLKIYVEGTWIGDYGHFADDGRDPDGWSAPRIRRPTPDVPESVAEYLPLLQRLCGFVGKHRGGANVVWLIDGLDRISDPIIFDELVEPLMRAFKEVGMGLVVVGPRRSIAGLDRLGAAASFDELHWMGPVLPSSPEGREFLTEILEKRDMAHIVSPLLQAELVTWSGGAVRLLLQLARDAVKEAWIRNRDMVGGDEVTAAADKLGRSLLLGLTNDDVALLGGLLSTGTFAVRRAQDAALVLSNRVLEYQLPSGAMSHSVHPTLKKFVLSLATQQHGEKA